MSENTRLLTGEDRRREIERIRREKGHLLGRGVVVSARNPGFVPGLPPIDEMKYSVPVSSDDGVTYVYKGMPETSVRHVPSDKSEYVDKRRPLRSLGNLVEIESDSSPFAQVTDDAAFVAHAMRRAAEINDARAGPTHAGWYFCGPK